MKHDFILEHDLACVRCKYNLRTQRVTARCPECGYPVLRSYVYQNAKEAGSHLSPYEIPPLTALRVLARLLDRNVDSILFVLTAYRHAYEQNTPRRNIFKLPRFDARAICNALRDHALEHYGSRETAIATLRFWQLTRSEDVGEVMFGLVEVGLVTPEESDSPRDFDGLFTLETLFP
jgi:uncharacterized repeat protein (TIGR04138 family)